MENIEILKGLIVFGLFGFFLASFIVSGRTLNKIDQMSKVMLNIHNRGVMLGMDGSDPNNSIRNDCFHTSDFLKMNNTGTFDTSSVADLKYHSYAKKEDFYLEEKL